MNIILLTLVFMLGPGKATFTKEFDSIRDCRKEIKTYVAILKKQEITPLVAKCELKGVSI